VGLSSVEYRVDGVWVPYGTAFVLAGPDGHRTIGYRATDQLGNAATFELALVLDNTPPMTTISQEAGTYPSNTTFALLASDVGSGVALLEYRVDSEPWAAYADSFTLSEGRHTIGIRSSDRVGNAEAERSISVAIAGAPISHEMNWKPLVAAVFAAVLVLFGAWSSRRVPSRKGARRVLRAFALVSFPFVLAEAATGVVSLITGLLTIPR